MTERKTKYLKIKCNDIQNNIIDRVFKNLRQGTIKSKEIWLS